MLLERISAIAAAIEAFRMGNQQEKNQKMDEETFGSRLARIRKEKGLTQTELGKAIGVSQRMMAYYEGESERPPAHLLSKICRALNISTDELLGIKDIPPPEATGNKGLLKKLRQAEKLPTTDQKTLLRVLDGLLAKNSQA